MAGSAALVGLPGSGKTAVGRRLSQRLGVPFVDTDQLIEDRIGCSIRDYFEREGESRFRDVEEGVLSEIAADFNGILSTGGGIVLRAANRAQLRNRFHVFYLRSSPEDLFRRLRHDVKRPLLQVADPLGRLREMHAMRDPLYRETARDIVETGRPSIAMLVNMITMQLELAQSMPSDGANGPSS